MLGDFIELDQLKLLAGQDRLNMTRLALNLSGYVNGVARSPCRDGAAHVPGYRDPRHHQRRPCRRPGRIRPSRRLFQGVAPDWRHDPEVLARADQLPDDAVWAAHAEAKRDLLARDRSGWPVSRCDPTCRSSPSPGA